MVFNKKAVIDHFFVPTVPLFSRIDIRVSKIVGKFINVLLYMQPSQTVTGAPKQTYLFKLDKNSMV